VGAVSRADSLSSALEQLTLLGSEQDRDAITRLRDRLTARRLRVLVAGEAKRGKSTLVNALLGRQVLPVGVLPLTALATTVRYGADEVVTAEFAEGRTEALPVSALDDLVTERGNPGNRRGLRAVTVLTNARLLARGVELVDTPGTGSVHSHNTLEAESAIATMDAAVFVLTADPPVSASERELIARVAGLSAEMFVVLNKADRLGHQDLAEVLAFTAQVVSDAAGRALRVYPVSARAALGGGGDAGFAEFAGDFSDYLDIAGAADLRRSVAGHAARLAESLRDEAAVARRAAQMRGDDASQQVRAFAARLAAVRDRRRDAADLVRGQSSRMLRDLNQSAALAERDCTLQVRRQLDEMLDGELGGSPAADIERAGRAKLAELTVAEAEAWRCDRTGHLEAGLSALDERLTDALRAELDAVRQAASALLGLDLTAAAPARRLVPDVRFFYQAADEAGQTELLAGAIRRHLPGEAGRSRARERLRREAADLMSRQLGRARGDLQYRLAEAARQLAAGVDARFAEGTGRLENALADADALRGATSQEVASRDLELAGRLAAVDQVLALLAQSTVQTADHSGVCP
jgi:GTP-binding protein EngB required for normal cell division